jgi:hypothetical protein
MSSADTLLEWLDRAIDEAQAELGAEQSEFDRLFNERLDSFDWGCPGLGWVTHSLRPRSVVDD